MDVDDFYAGGSGNTGSGAEEKVKPRTLSQKFHAATRDVFRRDFPPKMRTMLFKESVTVPYTETTYGEIVGFSGFLYETPRVRDKTYKAERFTCYEAKKFETGYGPLYQICSVVTTRPGLNRNEDRNEFYPVGIDRMTKLEALLTLRFLENECMRTLGIAKDRAHTRKYFGDYIGDVPLPPPLRKKPYGIFKI